MLINRKNLNSGVFWNEERPTLYKIRFDSKRKLSMGQIECNNQLFDLIIDYSTPKIEIFCIYSCYQSTIGCSN